LGEQVPDNDAEADGLCRIIDSAGDADLLAQAVRRNTERLGPLWGRLAQLRFAGPPGSRPSADQRAALIGAVRELLPQGAPDQPGEGLTAADWRALRQGGSAWLATASLKALPVPAPADEPLIEALADATHRQGLFTVWSGYTAQDIKSEDRLRRPNDIRVARRSGRLLHALVRARQARRVLEIGSGFGVSGMYLNAALARLPQGRLKTFEANADWQPIAAANIAVTGPLPESVAGPFTPTSLAADERFDLVFIDAIHTPAAVQEQLDAVHPHLDPGALVVVDDVRFSPEMLDHWRGEAKSARWAASFELFGRFGILEVA
ncbi:MAG: class I SAM-dependent methyltransferase, partial [Burkholderiales bacterium]|nr:class I SAM-dependent methyltransferase [Burkholderiales bacterium]